MDFSLVWRAVSDLDVAMERAARQLGKHARGSPPRFFLYGEAPREADEDFVHIETIAQRSRPRNWSIAPHAHADLHQLLLITSGGGVMRTDGEVYSFSGPALLAAPAGSVHGFEFEAEAQGYVLSIAERMMRDVAHRAPEIAHLFSAPRAVAVPAEAALAHELEDSAQKLGREIVWAAIARRAAVEARLTVLLCGAVRAAFEAAAPASPPQGKRAQLVANFRALVEMHLRDHWALEAYAQKLSVTLGRLRAACLDITGRPPVQLLRERLILEAKRGLIYSDLGVTELAYDLGFDDPAYFSRFFSEAAGISPRGFRNRNRSPNHPLKDE